MRKRRKRIKNVLLVGNPYNAFLLEEAGFCAPEEEDPADAPRFQLVRDAESAMRELATGKYQMLLADQALSTTTGSQLVARARDKFPDVPAAVFSGNTDLGGPVGPEGVDKNLFIYFGNPSFWRALVRLHEDEINADELLNHNAMAIMMVEDEPNFYSHFLPTLYERLRNSAIELLPEEKRPKSIWGVSRNRPLVLLRRTFEEACEVLVRYPHRLMALITDLCYPVAGERDADAGLRMMYRSRAMHGHLPVVVASRDRDHREAVLAANAQFLWKDSPRLLSELDNFLTHFCGFGPFVFRWPAGERYGLARTLQDLRDLIADVPEVVFEHHALHQDFVAWLAVRGFNRIARHAYDLNIAEADLRAPLLKVIDEELETKAELLATTPTVT